MAVFPHVLGDLPRTVQLLSGHVSKRSGTRRVSGLASLDRGPGDFVGVPGIGDLNNRFFPALPLPTDVQVKELNRWTATYEELLRELESINQRLIAAEWRHVREIQAVMAIAGGDFKLHALWTLLITGMLNDPSQRRLVSELCTDASTSTKLLEARASFEKSDPDVKKWFTTMSRKLFQ